MKKVSFPLFALMLGIAITAFTVTPQKANAFDPQYHWFDSNNGTYLGFRSVSIQEMDCPETGSLCADAFTNVTQDELPAGSYITSVEKQ